MFYLEDLKQSTKQGEIIMDPIDETIQYYTKTAANLEAYILWFNRLSNFVASKIVMCFKKDERVELIEFFIDVAYECFQLENFNSSMAIIGDYFYSSEVVLKFEKHFQSTLRNLSLFY